MNEPHHQEQRTTLIEQTHHSTIEECIWQGTIAVLKRVKNVNDPRARDRWKKEVEALRITDNHVRNNPHVERRPILTNVAQDHIAFLLDASASYLTITLRHEHGLSLDKYIDTDKNSTLSRADGTIVLRQLASALAHIHAHGIVHDDVKPDNIMWASVPTSRAVLIDFGAALNLAHLPSFNPSGTPSYVPPEFLDKRKGVEGDIWGLGVVMLFVWGNVTLPDGDWLLPGVWDEGGDVKMRQWLGIIGTLTAQERAKGGILGHMLEEDPDKRIRSDELVTRLAAYSSSVH